ncbi:MAG: ABC transporter ATP-binding protein [Deferribacteraceae bacterium]|jgi:iron complex transport system ATP-binding protein|nr:ABC transporter ATP-binding protein [Deferribacteraceae bacterium]
MVLELQGVCFEIGGRQTLKGVNLSVGGSCMLCVMGASGAGKTTLLKLIDGLIKPSEGGILLFGKELASYKRRELARILSYVPQFAPFETRLTTEEYLITARFAYMNLFGSLTKTDRDEIDKALALTGTEGLRDRDISTLSGGEMRRVMLASALAQSPQVILLDEPTVYLDPKGAVEILLLLQRIYQSGITVIMVTHDVNQALLFGSDFAGFKNGAIFFHESSVKYILDNELIDTLFDMRFHKVYHPADQTLQLVPAK